MLEIVNKFNVGFKGTFEVKKLPTKELDRFTTEMSNEAKLELSNTINEARNVVINQFPAADKVKFELFKSSILNDLRYKITYSPGKESKALGSKQKTYEDWPYENRILDNVKSFLTGILANQATSHPTQVEAALVKDFSAGKLGLRFNTIV